MERRREACTRRASEQGKGGLAGLHQCGAVTTSPRSTARQRDTSPAAGLPAARGSQPGTAPPPHRLRGRFLAGLLGFFATPRAAAAVPFAAAPGTWYGWTWLRSGSREWGSLRGGAWGVVGDDLSRDGLPEPACGACAAGVPMTGGTLKRGSRLCLTGRQAGSSGGHEGAPGGQVVEALLEVAVPQHQAAPRDPRRHILDHLRRRRVTARAVRRAAGRQAGWGTAGTGGSWVLRFGSASARTRGGPRGGGAAYGCGPGAAASQLPSCAPPAHGAPLALCCPWFLARLPAPCYPCAAGRGA